MTYYRTRTPLPESVALTPAPSPVIMPVMHMTREVRVVAISVGYRKFARSSQGERWAGARALWGRLERTMPFENGAG